MLDCRLRSAAEAEPNLLMRPLGLKPRRRGGKEPPPATQARSGEAQREPRLKKLRILFVLLGLGVLGARLDRVRDDGGRLPGPARDLQLRPVQGRRGTAIVVGATGEPLGTLTSNQNKILLNSGQISPNIKNAVVSIEDTPLLRTQRRRLQGHRPRPPPRHPQPERRTGRLDDHPAVRQAGAGSGKQPDGPREVPRGGARLPARAPLEQGQDPHRVPQYRLLRRGRLRDRGRRPHLLRRRPPRLRDHVRALRGVARAL